MFRPETWRATARLTTVIAALVGALVVVATAQAWSGSGGIGDDAPPPTEPTDPSTPSAGAFPVIGKHSYGDGFGAGRDHPGQDLIAKCGKPVVSAQAGRVQKAGYHSAAGNYVVVDGEGARKDLVYAHLQRRSALRKRERVAAGEAIGRVGDTGNASTCHLHFEIWSNPGYYEGGDAINPTPALKAWDKAKRTSR